MLRFASSPTCDMHIGNLRIALLNYIISKQRGEDLIIRIEDTDKEKNIEGKDQEILDTLGLFNIESSQTIYQSESVRFHTAMALQLIHEKKAFSCFCSDNWLDKKREEAKQENKEYRYDDACRNLPAELVIDNMSPFTIRITRPDNAIAIKDHIKGDVSFGTNDVDSFIIMNHDKRPTYDFSCAVDDMLSNISIVIRDEKHMSNTPKQDHIRALLAYDKKIEYAHLPRILNGDTISVKSLLEEGFLPEAISNYLISIGNKTPKEIFTLNEAQDWFLLENMSKSPTPFNIDVLRHINKEHLKLLDTKELSRYVGFADEEIGSLARIYLEEASTTKELKAKISQIFAPRDIPEEFSSQAQTIVNIIKKAPFFENYTDFKNHIIKESQLTEKDFSIVFRILLTNTQDGPEMGALYNCLKNYIGEIIK
ncbi:glutamate--tRNA ligase [Sulfurimonas sp.]|jgi:glutamyl-tRNA synthetase|uniref:glutamate--tRNA ligase n=1 Tax=Sulfurimonas sp. TaxID=2022749 RepID=UPI0025CF5CA4|nr:glutamate--tRNA ligase [Sulfurimonas sp.]MBT5935675.1 glutamate--tRNA ligase [Sulfurimonas sp.]